MPCGLLTTVGTPSQCACHTVQEKLTRSFCRQRCAVSRRQFCLPVTLGKERVCYSDNGAFCGCCDWWPSFGVTNILLVAMGRKVRGKERLLGFFFFLCRQLSRGVVTPSNSPITAGAGNSPTSGERRGYRGAADPGKRSGGKLGLLSRARIWRAGFPAVFAPVALVALLTRSELQARFQDKLLGISVGRFLRYSKRVKSFRREPLRWVLAVSPSWLVCVGVSSANARFGMVAELPCTR